MDNVTFVEAEVWTVARTDKGNAVLVRPVGSELAVPIFIGQLEAQSILIGLGDVPMPRPLTHDLFITVLEKMHLDIDRVEISDLKESTFYSRLVLRQRGKKFIIDSRPSDSLGLAVRVKCPIFIAESIVNEVGVSIRLISEEDAGTIVPSPAELEITRLESELQKAVDNEHYEEAARIRDRLNDLQ